MDARTTAQPICFNNEGGRIAIQAAEYHVHGNNIVNEAQDAALEKLPYAAEAPFNAYTKQHEPICLPSTRTALLDEIYSWTDGRDEQCVYWLNGLAGTGKSTIARTVARRHYERKSLGASFFFSKGGGDVSHAGKFATSIAVQLARNIPASRQHICKAIAERPDISKHSLRDQWQHLVLTSLSALDNSDNISSLVLVIDALDECDNDNDIRIVIGLLAEAQELSGPRLRIFLTSRPEVAIRHGFYHVPDALHQRFELHHISSSIVDADIKLFLEHSLSITGREQHLPAGWPGPQIVAIMVQRANGLFIWAATAHRFIQQGRRFAARRLDSIINSDGDTRTHPERHLDNIYTTVLQNSLHPEYTAEEKEEHCKMLRFILGSLVVMKSPLPVQSLGELLDVAEESIRSVVEDLHAILDVPVDETRPLRLHHPSLRDFLLDKSRCSDANFWVDEAQIHTALASRCITLMTSFFEQSERWSREHVSRKHDELASEITRFREQLEENDGKLTPKSCGDFASKLEAGLTSLKLTLLKIDVGRAMNLDEAEKAMYPPEFQYACLNWARHFNQSGKKPSDDGQASIFIREYHDDWESILFYWLEHRAWLANMRCLTRCFSNDDSPLFLALLEEKFEESSNRYRKSIGEVDKGLANITSGLSAAKRNFLEQRQKLTRVE